MRTWPDGYWRATLRASLTVVMSSNSPESTRTGTFDGCVEPGGTGGCIRGVGAGQERQPVKPMDGRVIHWLTVSGAKSRRFGNAAIAWSSCAVRWAKSAERSQATG